MTIDYSTLKELISNSINDYKTLLYTLIGLIIVNLIFEILKFCSSIFLSNKEKSNSKQLLLDERRIDIQEKLYKSLHRLKLYDKRQTDDMLIDINDISSFTSKNKLFISKELLLITNQILDYFKGLLLNYNEKNIETEIKLFDKYFDEFNKK